MYTLPVGVGNPQQAQNDGVSLTREYATHIQELLSNRKYGVGWPIAIDGVFGPKSQAATLAFQRAFNPGPNTAGVNPDLAADGVPGPETEAALRLFRVSTAHLSPHFTYTEFACGHGQCAWCGGWCEVPRHVLAAAETLRAGLWLPNGHAGLTVVGGSRCATRNRAIGGASNSQHLHVNLGNALDVEPYFTVPQVRDAGAGITAMEVRQATGERVWHTDCRPGDPGNPLVFGWGLRDDGC